VDWHPPEGGGEIVASDGGSTHPPVASEVLMHMYYMNLYILALNAAPNSTAAPGLCHLPRHNRSQQSFCTCS
jgi:hypothetical protein